MSEHWLSAAYDDYHEWKGWRNTRNSENDVSRALAELRMTHISPPSQLLEIGFGDGAFLRRAQALGYQCAGLERDDALIPDLRAEGIDARLGSPDQFNRAQFDVIVAFDVFEHIAIAELIDMLRKLAGILRPDGRLVARFPNMASPFGLVNQYGDITHITGLSPTSFTQIARLAGLETVKVANGATVLSGSSGIRSLMKPFSILTRLLLEFVFSFAYYGKMTPLSPSVVVVLRKNA